MVNVAAISYLNTLPFVYGLENHPISKELDLHFCTPSQGAKMIESGKADIGIIPVAAAINIPNSKFVTDYCIGATSYVASVLLCSNVELKDIKKIYLDIDSCTSVMLCRILCKQYWKINPQFENFNFYSNDINPNNSYIIIGDKAMLNASRFKYVYDMANEWIKFKNKPFVFACWTTAKDLDEDFISRFNQALKFGINNIDKAVETGKYPFDKAFAYKYLQDNISFPFDSYKREGLKDFWSLALAELKSKVRW